MNYVAFQFAKVFAIFDITSRNLNYFLTHFIRSSAEAKWLEKQKLVFGGVASLAVQPNG